MDGSAKSRKRPCLRRCIDSTSLEDGCPQPFGQWASLPQDPFSLIHDKLREPIDHICVAAVCKHWRSAAKACNQTAQYWRCNSNANHSNVLPMLLIPTEPGRDKLALYSVSEGKAYENVELKPVPFRKRCCGSSLGWLATVDRMTDQGGLIIALTNPFHKRVDPIYLPPLENVEIAEGYADYYEHYVSKVILSADPALFPNTYVAIALYGGQMYSRCAFIKGGQSHWTIIQLGIYTDVLFYKAQAYLVTMHGEIGSLDVNATIRSNVKGRAVPKYHGTWFPFAPRAYLVESTKGDLLHIERSYTNNRTDGFKVFKLVFDEKDGSVVRRDEVTSMGDEAVFVGDNNSVCVSASKFPGCKPNSIYYTDDWTTIPIAYDDGDPPRDDMGIFNLEDPKIKPLYSPYANRKIPIWVVPRFDALEMQLKE